MQGVLNKYDLVCQVYENYMEFERILSSEIGEVQGHNGIVDILEIGTGSGITTEIILNGKENIKVTSIDNDINAIKIAEKKLVIDNVELVYSDALEFIKNSDAKFDVIASAFTIHNFERGYRNELYKEIYGALKNGGVFINADKYSPDIEEKRNEALRNIIGRYFDVFIEAGEVGLLKSWVLHYILDQSEEIVMKAQESLKQMEQYGFTEVNFIYQEESKMMAVLKAKKAI